MDVDMDVEPCATLMVYKGEFGLLSICPRSLHLLLYLRLHPTDKVEIKTTETLYLLRTPALVYANAVYDGQFEITNILENLVEHNIDEELSEEERDFLVESKDVWFNILDACYVTTYWGHAENYHFFLDLFNRSKLDELKTTSLFALKMYANELVNNFKKDDSLETALNEQYTDLSNFFLYLDRIVYDKSFILGNRPSTLDALVCGYLAPLLYINMPYSGPTVLLKGNRRLCRYVERFMTIYGNDTAVNTIQTRQPIYDCTTVFLVCYMYIVLMVSMCFFRYLNRLLNG